ncbi:MAG: polysaccharide biosynthesis/export family protein [Bacteroidota bacterium]
MKTPKKIRTNEAVYILSPDSNAGKDHKAEYRHRIKPGDRLMIKFLNNYDIGQAASQSATSTANLDGEPEKGYLVNYDSTVTLPLIGRVKLIGYSRLEAAQKLEQEYGKFVINPIIEVDIASLSVTILGEVAAPGKILIDKENTTVIDVIALSGGIKDSGKKNRIRIIRGKEVVQLDLRKIEVLESKAIIIQDGDIIYVEPYGLKASTEALSSLQTSTFVILTISQLTLLTIQLLNYSR